MDGAEGRIGRILGLDSTWKRRRSASRVPEKWSTGISITHAATQGAAANVGQTKLSREMVSTGGAGFSKRLRLILCSNTAPILVEAVSSILLWPEKRPLAIYSYCDGPYEQNPRLSTDGPRHVPVLQPSCSNWGFPLVFCYN